MKRLEQDIIDCNDCPYVHAYSLDGIASALCGKSGMALPAHGKEGTAIMVMDIPPECPLPNTPKGETES